MSSSARKRANRTGPVQVDNGGVAMKAHRQMRLLHRSDVPTGAEQCFGGDTMGHWNVARINRILDAMNAPVVQMTIPSDVMVAMARVGAPNPIQAAGYAARGLASIPPLSFVSVGHPARPQSYRWMLVDGHHRLLALAMAGAISVPARILPGALADDVRVIEMSEVAVFPEEFSLGNEVVIEARTATASDAA